MGKPYPQDKRKYYRIKLPQPLICKVSIANVGERLVRSGTTMILIQDIGPGGLKFLSNLKFPVNDTLVLFFQTRLLGEEIKVHGGVVRVNIAANGFYEFGVKFIIDSTTRDSLAKLLNKLMIRLRAGKRLANSDFFTEDIELFFNP